MFRDYTTFIAPVVATLILFIRLRLTLAVRFGALTEMLINQQFLQASYVTDATLN